MTSAAKTIESDFEAAMRAAGVHPAEPLMLDGTLHRVRLEDDKRGNRSGWYCAHADNPPTVVFGDWRNGEVHRHCLAADDEMSADERAEIQERIEAVKKAREAERARLAEEAAERAAAVWSDAEPAPANHEYLARKGIEAHGARVHHDGRLILPLLNFETGEPRGVQFISGDSAKRFLTGTVKRGHGFTLGALEGVKTLVCAEGFATAASVHQATGLPVVCAFDAGNLRPVAESIRKAHPDAAVIVAADNDESGTGQDKANAAAAAVGGRVAIPPETGDWNDYAAAHGLDKVRAAFEAAHDAPADGDAISNFVERDGKRHGLPLPAIAERVYAITDGWPRRTGRLIFVPHATEGVVWIDSAEHLIAWLNSHAPVKWAGGTGHGENSLRTERQLFAYLQQTATAYDAVETIPHEPPRSKVFYAWEPPEGYAPDGRFLDELLGYFDNADTDADAALIRALFLTPAWGGDAGTRPCFVVAAPDRGCGKSTLTDVLGEVYGGMVEIEPGGKDDRVVSRLLTPDALTRRLVRVDNVKNIAGGALIESLITAREISGHRLYTGEASRLNCLTWCATANTPRLSRDLADRSFIIRLSKPEPQPGWREAVLGFASENRDLILADIVHTLQQPPAEHQGRDRWQGWLDAVLARVVAPGSPVMVEEIVRLNQARRDDGDEEIEESQTIVDTLRAAEACFIPASDAVARLNTAFSTNRSAQYWGRRLKAHIAAGRLPGITSERRMNCNGWGINS